MSEGGQEQLARDLKLKIDKAGMSALRHGAGHTCKCLFLQTIAGTFANMFSDTCE